MNIKSLKYILLLFLFAGCDTIHRGNIYLTYEKSREARALKLFKQLAKEYDYLLSKQSIEGSKTVIYAKKAKNPKLTLKISSDSIVIEVYAIGGWRAPSAFDVMCENIHAKYQQEFDRDKVELIKK